MQVTVVDVPERERYEARTADGVFAGFAAYQRSPERVVITHVVVPTHLRGQGIASQLTVVGLDDARAAGLSVVPQCWFVAQYVDNHPEYAGLVATEPA